MAIKQRDIKTARLGFIATVVLCLMSGSGLAQTTPGGGIAPPARPERPYRGLFGGGSGNTAQSLTVELKLGGGIVENPGVEQGAAAAVDPSAGAGGSVNASTIVAYSMDRTRWGASTTYKSLIDYYAGYDHLSVWNRHFIAGRFYFMPTASTRVSFMPEFKNVPELSVGDLFDPLEQGLPPNQDFALSLERYQRVGAGLEVSHNLSKRTRINLEVNYGHGRVPAQSKEWVILKGFGRISHFIGKGMALYVGYEEGGQRDVIAGARTAIERQPRINGGVDMSRALSLTRRTLVAFSTGVAGVQDRSLDQTTYHLIGAASISREFGRTWVTALTYSRDVRNIEPIGDPLFSNSVTVSVMGSFSPRLQFQSSFGQSVGHIGPVGRIENLIGGAQLSYALSRQLAFGADYADNRLTNSQASLPVEAFGQRNNWNTRSVRAYVQIWIPLISRRLR